MPTFSSWPAPFSSGAAVIEINPEETDFSAEVTYAPKGLSALLLPQFL
jgi:hypothetical protein